MTRLLPNPLARAAHGAPPLDRAPYAFHRRFPGYTPTPLTEMPALAASLGVGHIWVKDESARLGLPSFKILGASWATYRALTDRLGDAGGVARCAARRPRRPPADDTGDRDGRQPRAGGGADGANCSAVGHMCSSRPARHPLASTRSPAKARPSRSSNGTYDEAVAQAATEAGPDCLVISDTSWPGYEAVPRWITEGYSTIFAEADVQLGGERAGPRRRADRRRLTRDGGGAALPANRRADRRRRTAERGLYVGIGGSGPDC